MEILEMLKILCAAPSVSGDEAGAADAVNACAADAGLTFERDALGNFISQGGSGVAVLAHVDKIGYMVTGIDEATGFLRIAKAGGTDARTAPAQRVTVYGKQTLTGVIVSTPPHLLPKDADNKVLPIEKLTVDCGLTYDEIKEIVRPGDRILTHYPLQPLAGTRVSAPYLDNCAGIAAALKAAEKIKETGGRMPRIILTAMEETGGSGAKTASFPEDIKTVIAVDTTFAAAPGLSEEESAPMGSGARIGFAPILNRDLSKTLVSLAKENGIPCTVEVMGRKTGTDADDAAVAGTGRVTGLISIPIRYMHTPAETADLRDIEATAKLLAVAAAGSR